MRVGLTSKLIVVALAMALVVPAATSAATKTWAGTTEGGGDIAMDVKVSKKGAAMKIVQLRGVGLPGECDISGAGVPLNTRMSTAIKVKTSGRFSFSLTDPEYGNTRSIKGKFAGKKDKTVKGTFVYAGHFPAEGEYPEENCHTAELSYTAKRGAPEVPFPARAAAARR